MAGVFGLFLPSAEERGLNERLLAENHDHLAAEPEWSPPEMARWPRAVVRFHNRVAPRLPMAGPLGWIDGTTWADDRERERIAGLPEEEQADAGLVHARAVHFRSWRTRPVPTAGAG